MFKATSLFLGVYAIMALAYQGYAQKKSKMADLNGDGIKDTIYIDVRNEEGLFTLKINQTIYNGETDNMEDMITIVDINKKDNFKQVALQNIGPSEDYSTLFLGYDGKKIYEIGQIEGVVNEMQINGTGKLTTKTRGSILHTWWFDDVYFLNSMNKLQRIFKKYYAMDGEGNVSKVTVLHELNLVKYPENRVKKSDNIIKLKLGEKILLVKTDNKKWVQVRRKGGGFGWFSVNDFNIIDGLKLPATEVFDGLSMAD